MSVLVSDSFNRADSTTTLGTTDSYNGGTAKAWSSVVGTWGISSNRAYNATVTNDGFALVDCAVSDVKITVTLAAVGLELGIYFRSTDANNRLRIVFSTGVWYLQKKVSGVQTTIASKTLGLTAGDTIRMEASGSALNFYVNNVLQITASDSFNSTVTKHGIGTGTASASARWDNFIVEDLVTGATPVAGGGTLTGTGSLSATGSNNISGGSALTGLGSLSASGRNNISGSSAMTASGSLTASGSVAITGGASLTATGSLTASGVVSILGGAIAGGATLTAVGSLTASGRVVTPKMIEYERRLAAARAGRRLTTVELIALQQLRKR